MAGVHSQRRVLKNKQKHAKLPTPAKQASPCIICLGQMLASVGRTLTYSKTGCG